VEGVNPYTPNVVMWLEQHTTLYLLGEEEISTFESTLTPTVDHSLLAVSKNEHLKSSLVGSIIYSALNIQSDPVGDITSLPVSPY